MDIVGGGPKKVMYTLSTLKQIGVRQSAKALTARNACKACGLGMGGQLGGMTNERREFPSVCNKSVQAQSTDIQQAIPAAVFALPVNDLKQLSAFELEHLGRVGAPLFKHRDSDRFHEVDWQWALDYSAERFRATDPARTFFYSSGRSSNEAGFVLQLLARLYGTNNVNNCSYYCHQATGVGLEATVGTGTATIELDDLYQCDLIFVIGANPASNHPRFIHQLKNCRDRGGQVIVINPAREPGLVKFAVPKSVKSMIAGGSEIASLYLQPHIGSDVALLKGLAKAVLEASAQDHDFIAQHTVGFAGFAQDIAATPWPMIEQATGLTQQAIAQAATLYSQSRHAVFAWGMGITHHLSGCVNVEYIANLALLRGMIGKRHAGLLPLRGHSNVQGIGTIGVKPVLPGDVFANIEQHLNVKLPTHAGYDTLAALEAAGRGDIDCALMLGGNLYSASPDSTWTAAALGRIGFKLFLTTTLNQGHLQGLDQGDTLILPVAARDEEPQSTTQESMFNFVRLSDGGIERLPNAKSEVTILAELGRRMVSAGVFDFTGFLEFAHVRQAIAHTVPGMEGLEDIDVARQEFHVSGRLLHTPRFRTADGKAHFAVHPVPPPPHANTFPFLLATVRSEGQFNSIIYENTDSYRYGAQRDAVLMSPEDMAHWQLQHGDRITLVSPYGRMEAVQVQAFDLPAGNLLAYYPEANVLTGRTRDPRSKTPNFKSVPVSIERLG